MKLSISSAMRCLLTLLISALLTACSGGGMNDLDQYVREVKSREAGEIEPLPMIKQIETYNYTGEGRRNPFFPIKNEEETLQANISGISPDPHRRKEELESYPLDTLRMVGTLDQNQSTWALVRTNANTIYRVKTGNYLGQHHGQITLVTENKIELTEIVTNGQGGFRERQASLALAE